MYRKTIGAEFKQTGNLSPHSIGGVLALAAASMASATFIRSGTLNPQPGQVSPDRSAPASIPETGQIIRGIGVQLYRPVLINCLQNSHGSLAGELEEDILGLTFLLKLGSQNPGPFHIPVSTLTIWASLG